MLKAIVLMLTLASIDVQANEFNDITLAESLLERHPTSRLHAVISTYCDERITVSTGTRQFQQVADPSSTDRVSAETLALDVARCGRGDAGFLAALDGGFSTLERSEQLEIAFRETLSLLDAAERTRGEMEQTREDERAVLAARIVQLNATLEMILDERANLSAASPTTSQVVAEITN